MCLTAAKNDEGRGEIMGKRRFDLCKLMSTCVKTLALSGILALALPLPLEPQQAEAASLGGAWFAPTAENADGHSGEDTMNDMVCLDISQGSIYISASGYRIGESSPEIAFQGVYKITGNSEEAHGIEILSGEHTVILDNMDIDQRTLRQCYPMLVGADSVLHLYLRGENTLFAGSGYGGITLAEGADMDIQGFGQGTLSLLAYPEKNGDSLVGTSAIDISETSTVTYPCGQEGCDEVMMYAGANRLSNTQIFQYDNQPYLKIQYSITHECHLLSEPANCLRSQYCLECGREVAGKTAHVPGAAATCTEPQLCTVCQEVLTPPTGHFGVWKAESVERDGKIIQQEVMTCTICGKTLVRDMVPDN